MHRLCSRSRPLLSFMASAPHRCWPPALVGRVFPPMESTDPPVRRARRFPHGSRNMASTSGVKSGDISKLDMRLLRSANENPAITQGMSNVEREEFKAHGAEDIRKSTMDVIYGDGNVCRTALEAIDVKSVDASGHLDEIVINDEEYDGAYYDNWYAKTANFLSCNGVTPLFILPKSSHHDGSIYKRTHDWKEYYRFEDRNETCLEAMMLTEPPDCFFPNDLCWHHKSRRMFQIFSVKLAENPVGGLVQLYGYIAVRDLLDPLLNYVVNVTRDDPITVKQGSLINMTGPKRGIDFSGEIAIEFDMRIKTGEQEKNDLSLIDGASILNYMDTSGCCALPTRILGHCGAIDISISHLELAVEATIEVLISEVRRSFGLYLGCFTSGFKEEIQLFDGVIGESRCLKRSVVAVVKHSWMGLKFKVGLESSCFAEHSCSFWAANHGLSVQKIKTDSALFSVKVTWSALPQEV